MSKPIYLNECCASKKDFEPLIGCVLTEISEGVDEDGVEFATMKFLNPLKMEFIRLSIGEDSELSISGFEKE